MHAFKATILKKILKNDIGAGYKLRKDAATNLSAKISAGCFKDKGPDYSELEPAERVCYDFEKMLPVTNTWLKGVGHVLAVFGIHHVQLVKRLHHGYKHPNRFLLVYPRFIVHFNPGAI